MAGFVGANHSLFALLLALPFSADAAEWDTGDKAFGLAALTFTAADWRQTYLVAKQPHRWAETNNALGAHPSTGRVNNYFAGSILLGAGVADLLPATYRKGFLAGVAALEFNMVARGYVLGMRLGF